MSERSYQAIREAILTNQLKPETLWSDRELSDKFGLGRTPVREALLRLQAEKLVEILPRRGTRVLPLSVTDLKEIHQLAKALELEAALSIAGHENRVELTEPMRQAVEAMEAAIEAEDREAWVTADLQFHYAVVDVCGNARLCDTYHSLRELTDRARFFALYLRELPRQSTIEHRQMYEAIRAGNLPLLAELYRDHWTRITDELLAIIDRQAQQSPFPRLAHPQAD